MQIQITEHPLNEPGLWVPLCPGLGWGQKSAPGIPALQAARGLAARAGRRGEPGLSSDGIRGRALGKSAWGRGPAGIPGQRRRGSGGFQSTDNSGSVTTAGTGWTSCLVWRRTHVNSRGKSGTQTISWFAGAKEASSRRKRRRAAGGGPGLWRTPNVTICHLLWEDLGAAGGFWANRTTLWKKVVGVSSHKRH